MTDLSQRVAALTPEQRDRLRERLERRRGDGPPPREDAAPESAAEPIAVAGMACRFPGARGPEAFWRLLCDGVDAITEVPAERWDAAAFYDPDVSVPGKASSRWGGFLEDVEGFDAAFFGISPREAEHVDPQHRLLMEVAWEALEDAGETRERLRGSRAGVFVAIYHRDHARLALAEPTAIDAYTCTGTHHSIAANRLSYLFDLKGPSVVVDTACSSSLVALHLACQSLRAGECDLAVVGGVNLMLSPEETIAMSKWGMMAADGRCKSFDARADGFVRGEGCGVVVLKRAAGSRPRAWVRGSAVNQDGRSNGLTAPNAQAQEEVLRRALAGAGVAPREISFVETHGTGTSLGDPIEVEALAAVLGPGRDAGAPCLLGAVKANVGHLEAAAGLAGLIKTVLCMEHGEVPPQIHLVQRNPLIELGDVFVIPTGEPRPWRPEDRRYAGVSSFGMGGTNAHVVLEEANRDDEDGDDRDGQGRHLLVLSARTEGALQALAAAGRDRLAEVGSARELADLCHSAALRRSHFEHRLAVVGDDAAQMAAKLDAFLGGERRPGLASGVAPESGGRGLVFVFPGQGSQWLGMGRELAECEPVFRGALERCDEALRGAGGPSALDELLEGDGWRWHEMDVVQPLLFAMQVALAELWRSWGVEPDGVVGLSMGEVAAAHVAGALGLDDAARVICRRSRLLRKIRGRGAMAVVELTAREAEAAIAGREDALSVAALNGPRSTVLAGDPEALDEVLGKLEEDDVFHRRVKVDVASHSPQVDPLRAELAELLAGLEPRPGRVPIYSTVTAERTDGHGFDAAYWVDNLRRPVRFWDVLEQLVTGGMASFVEVSPHPVVLSGIEQGLHHMSSSRGLTSPVSCALPSLRREEPERATLLGSLAELHVRGFPVAWRRLLPGRPVALPSYPWQHRRFALMRPSSSQALPPTAHPLLPHPGVRVAGSSLMVWSAELDLARAPYLADHQVDGSIILPGTAYLEMAWVACAQATGTSGQALEDIRYQRPLLLDAARPQPVQLVLRETDTDAPRFEVFSRPPGADTAWTPHATGRLGRGGQAPPPVDLDAVRGRCPREVAAADFYHRFEEHNHWGPSFQGLARIWRGEGEVLACLEVPARLGPQLGRHRFHPAVLDAAGHLIHALLDDEAADAYVLGRIDRAVFHGPAGDVAWSHVTASGQARHGELVGDVRLLAEDGRVVAELLGLQMVLLESWAAARHGAAAARELTESLYRVAWEPCPLSAKADKSPERTWLVVADRGGVGQELAGRLREANEPCGLVEAETEDFERAVAEHVETRSPDSWRVVDLRGLDALPPEAIPEGGALVRPASGLVRLLRALAGLDAPPARLWVVTAGAQVVSDSDDPVLTQVPLWGLGRTLVSEHPEMPVRLLDLEAPNLGEQLFEELQADGDDGEDQVAWREGVRWAARLRRVDLAGAGVAASPLARLSKDAGYLVTGGLGDLGLAVARHLAERGARWLVLVSRTELPPRHQWREVPEESPLGVRLGAVLALERQGAHVHLASVDVGDPDALSAFLESYANESRPPIRGVVHAAGVQNAGALLELDETALKEVFAAKVSGSWLLHRAFAGGELDFFVFFSSASVFLSSPFLGGYAAANAFMDALAHYRRRRKQAALAVNWGFFSQVGMAVRYAEEHGRSSAPRGMGEFTPRQGLELLERLLSADPVQVGVMPIDWPEWSRNYPAAARSPLLRPLLAQSATETDGEASRPRRSLSDLAPEERPQAAEEILRERVAAVLRVAPAELPVDRPLVLLGLDSLLATELRNAIESELGVALPLIKVLTAGGLSDLADLVVGGARSTAS